MLIVYATYTLKCDFTELIFTIRLDLCSDRHRTETKNSCSLSDDIMDHQNFGLKVLFRVKTETLIR